jgi:hypothetical protein
LAPGDEFSQVHTPVATFAVVDPRLRLFQAIADFSLGKTGFLPKSTNEVWNRLVKAGMLGFGGHPRTIARISLDTISVSSHTGVCKIIEIFLAFGPPKFHNYFNQTDSVGAHLTDACLWAVHQIDPIEGKREHAKICDFCQRDFVFMWCEYLECHDQCSI